MAKIRICSVVTGNNLTEFLNNLNHVQNVSDFVELRVDFITNLELKDLKLIKKKTKKESIFTCRRQDEGGKFKQAEEKRREILKEAIKLGFGHLDIELKTLQEQKMKLTGNKTKIIISYHDFIKTPVVSFLKKIIKDMQSYSPDIIKIATLINKESDKLRLFRLMLDKSNNEQRIVIGMGEKGKITRIMGPILGNYLTYTSAKNSKTAAGQINISDLKLIYQLIGIN